MPFHVRGEKRFFLVPKLCSLYTVNSIRSLANGTGLRENSGYCRGNIEPKGCNAG